MSKDVSNLESQESQQLTDNPENLKELLNEFFGEEGEPEAALKTESVQEEEPEKDRSQVADAIAAAIASTFDDDFEPVFPEQHPQEPEEIREEPQEELLEEPVPEAQPAPAPEEEPVPEEPTPEETDSVAAQPEPKAEPEPPKAEKKSSGARVQHPGTGHKKIARSHVRVPAKDKFASLFSGMFERRREALPPGATDLREHEKNLSAKTGIDRMLNPVRYVFLILMFLCLGGRKYSWMTLGFMKGIGGVYVSLLFTLILLILNWQSLYRAVRDMVYMQFSYESYLLIATILTALEAVITKNAQSLMPLLTMSWCFCGMANLMDAQGNLRFLRSTITGRNRVGIRSVENRYQGQNLIGKAPSGTHGFVRRQAEPDIWHYGNSFFFLPLLLLCVVVSAYLSAKTQERYISILVYLLDIGVPVSMAICCARPYSLLSQALSGKGVVAGWAGIKGLSGRKMMLVYDSDLFPKGTTGHKGVKVYGRYTASQLISYGASMVIRADVGLTEVFTRLLRDGDGEMLEVRHLQILEGGMEGRIHGGRVLLGTYQFMQLMGVEVPRKGSTNGVYIAVNGSLAGMFAVKYALRSGSVRAFRRLTQEKSLTPLVVTRNFTINPAFIEKSYKVSIHRMVCPKTEVRRNLSMPVILKGGATCGFVLRDGLNAYSRTVAGARRVRRMGMIYTALSMALTLYLVLSSIMAISSGTAMIEITRVLLMHFWLFVAVEVGARVAVRN